MKETMQGMRRHRLLTKELLEQFEKLGTQFECNDPIVVAKFFSPYYGWRWYATSYDPVRKVFFGYVEGHHGEWGRWSYKEIQELSLNGKGTIPAIERDIWFISKKFSELKIED